MTSGGADVFIYISDKHADDFALIDTIIHESVHVFQNIMEYVGEEDAGKEAEAYGIAHIATTLMADYATYKESLENGETVQPLPSDPPADILQPSEDL